MGSLLDSQKPIFIRTNCQSTGVLQHIPWRNVPPLYHTRRAGVTDSVLIRLRHASHMPSARRLVPVRREGSCTAMRAGRHRRLRRPEPHAAPRVAA